MCLHPFLSVTTGVLKILHHTLWVWRRIFIPHLLSGGGIIECVVGTGRVDKLDSSFSRSRSSSMSSLENISQEGIQCLAFADSYTKKSGELSLFFKVLFTKRLDHSLSVQHLK